MQKFAPLRIFIYAVILAVVAYLSYIFFLKEIILNNSTRKVMVTSLDEGKMFEFGKHDKQRSIRSFEMEIKGKTDRTLMIMYGPEKKPFMRSVFLKKGEIDFVVVEDWNSDSCYIIIPSEVKWKGELEISYRFIGSSN